MKILATDTAPTQIEADAIVAGVFDGGSQGPITAKIDDATQGLVTRLIDQGEISGHIGDVTRLYAPAGLQAEQLLLVGLGELNHFNQQSVCRAAGTVAKLLAARPRKRVAFYLDGPWNQTLTSAAISAAIAACEGQDLYRDEKKLQPFDELVWHGATEHALQTGEILGQSINLARRLVNDAPSVINPEGFANEALRSAQLCGLETEIWGRERLEEESCEALLAVARGSAHEPRLVVVRHQGGGPHLPILALVGKGVTFDSGGLSLKPSDGMKTMKCDMAGAATVLGAMVAIARLKLPVNVIGVMGLVENMVSGDSYKLGDVLRARNGKTIEVLNTDAEGRLVLADALDVAIKSGAERVIDVATLTGACMVALGTDVAGVMTNDTSLCDQLVEAAMTCGEPVWELPMFDLYDEQIQSCVADIKNVGEGRWGGAITAAKFLQQFVGDTPWVHIDIAGPSFSEKPKSWLDAGGSGAYVRTLVELARVLSNS